MFGLLINHVPFKYIQINVYGFNKGVKKIFSNEKIIYNDLFKGIAILSIHERSLPGSTLDGAVVKQKIFFPDGQNKNLTFDYIHMYVHSNSTDKALHFKNIYLLMNYSAH